MKNSYKFFQNRSCRFWMCHEGIKEKDFSCMFCYCPLYSNCDLNHSCTVCTFPHIPEHYDIIIDMLKKKNKKLSSTKYCTCGSPSGHSAGTLLDGKGLLGTDLIICKDCGKEMKKHG